MGRRSDAVKRWRKNTKDRIVKSMGGCCQMCGYDKCYAAMDLHHINPEEKEFGFGKIIANPKSWEKVVSELRKCVLLCNRCHMELHHGYGELPYKYETFNEDYCEYIEKKPEFDTEPCPVCGKKKRYGNITCGRGCASKRANKVDWDSVDLEKLVKEHTYVAIADMLGVSDMAVRKRVKKLGIVL